MEEKLQFLFSKDNYKYFDLDINDEHLFSRGISKKIDIEKNEAIDLLTEKIDFDSLKLCDNYNLHYNNWPFLVKIDHFARYKVTGISQKKKNFLVIESDPVQRLLSEVFHRIEAAVEKQNFVKLLCSLGVMQIDGRRLSLGKITYFKDAIILIDGLSEVIFHDFNKLFINAPICCGKVLLPSSFLE